MMRIQATRVLRVIALTAMCCVMFGVTPNLALTQKWVASWATSMHGPYPSGNAVAQPVLDAVFESAGQGAVDQTFRLIIKPDLWGRVVRLHFANTFGARAVTFDDVFVGLQNSAASLVPDTNVAVSFANGKRSLTLAAGESAFSDAVTLRFVARPDDPLLMGRRLAVSFHIVGSSGPMTWHAKAQTTSYMTAPHAGSRGADADDAAFPFTTTSWYFLDGLDVMAPQDTAVVACFGDSITDGTSSTLNGDDRWPDVLSRRLHAAYGTRVSVVNAGIGGNRIIGREKYAIDTPVSGGPSALERLDRDVLGLSGLSSIVWLEGINDLSQGASAEAVIGGMREVVRRVRAHGGVSIIAATITSSVGSTTAHGTPDADARRKAINSFIRGSGTFDGVADFDAVTRDDQTGGLRPMFVPNSTIGGPGDHLHPNRAGYQAMGVAVDLARLMPSAATAVAAAPAAVGNSATSEHRGLTAVSGIKVGHYTMPGRPTGCTVILPPTGAIASVDVRGGAPATKETELLNPVNHVQSPNAIVLSGGSAFGLDATTGVMRYLEEQGIGYDARGIKVPIVPAASLIDLAFGGDFHIRPNAECGYKAAQAASDGPVAEGNVGAGAGATVGKIIDLAHGMKAGIGTSAIVLPNGLTVAALVAVNAVGDIIDPATSRVIAGVRSDDGKSLADARTLLHTGTLFRPRAGENTTLGVVATNAKLTKVEALKMAQMAHDGYARAISPTHTAGDGDTIFAIATGSFEPDASSVNVSIVGALAADAIAEAIVRAATEATALGGLPAARDLGTLPHR
jgi:L-aminopeptidase/D-esterase-like protein/lysophospholipase L1-like esterase